MKSTIYRIQILILALISSWAILFSSCKKDDQGGKVIFTFEHRVGADMLVKDSMCYTNAAGNKYEVNELQYFISDICLWKDGSKVIINADSGVHYVDLDILSTLTWAPDQELAAGNYDSLTFTFGLNEARNVTGYFVNPPERDMFWPEMMGGGYHYMKMNGKWETPQEAINPFNLHLGIGMKKDSQENPVYIPNYFTVTLPLSDCYISDTQLNRELIVSMNINEWFQSPNIWDWNTIGGQIMQNQDAMNAAAQNGRNAFTVTYLAAQPKK